MWTVVRVRTYVPPGFSDSGWQTHNVIVAVVGVSEQEAKKAVYRHLRQTEVTKAVLLGFDQMAPRVLDWFETRCDLEGRWVDCEAPSA